MAKFQRFVMQAALVFGLAATICAQNDADEGETNTAYVDRQPSRLFDKVPEKYEAKPVVLISGGDRNAGAAYRYKNGYDYITKKGARLYDKNAGYGWAKETDVVKPNFAQWSKVYSTAQATSWGSKRPAKYRTPVTYY